MTEFELEFRAQDKEFFTSHLSNDNKFGRKKVTISLLSLHTLMKSTYMSHCGGVEDNLKLTSRTIMKHLTCKK